MTPFTQNIIQHSHLIGEFNVTKTKIKFETHIRKSSGQLDRKFFIEMGDVVYFLIADDELIKIGKAEGAGGFYSRMKQYCKGLTGDKTNRKILNYMSSVQKNNIKIYAVQTAKILAEDTDLLTGEKFEFYVSTANRHEQHYIQSAYKAGERLLCCSEKDKNGC